MTYNVNDQRNEVRDLEEVLKLPDDQLSRIFHNRTVSIPVSALHALRQELVFSIGEDRTKGVFIRYGWHTGVTEGQKMRELNWKSEEELVRAGPMLHKMHGHLDDVIVEEMKYDDEEEMNYIRAAWYNSYEVEKQLEFAGPADQPVCHTLCGFASGYLSSALGRPMLVKETKCMAVGDDNCEMVCKPIEDWGADEHENTYYQSSSVIEELDEVTAKLKRERDYLTTAHDVHKQMMEIILSKKELENIAELLHNTTGLPIFIEDENHNITAKCNGTTIDFDLSELDTRVTHFFELSGGEGLLRTPIYFENKIRGYCSFIYTGGSRPTPLEYMIIDQTSLTASIVLLHENIRIQTAQNIRRSFLADILDEKMDEDELYKVAKYLDFDPEGDYWVFTMEKIGNEDELNLEIEANEKVLKHVNLFFKQRGIETFASYKFSQLIVALEERPDNIMMKDKAGMINALLKHCKEKYKNYKFDVGVSSVENNIRSIPDLYKETEIALNTRTDDSGGNILYYDDLGVEKLLFQISDQSMLNRFVESQIGDLLEADKHDELTDTLKYYIENGMSINATSKAMAMSISGLRYRLEKISDLLGVEMDDTKALFSIYMALNVAQVKKKS
ncbi:XylR N-terminal domain-containing protein [Salinicoccus halitifaciens]|uniref:Sugar diacid utilization regulator n=1 Tax=Salinicoccus halitifaciens TaxID=1073415 RepID=A0ABV2E8D6_9STAP|nr:XylR N-terminal domain-containing protein [Salinicoccus halitifaciens]MCD2137819.1 XylR N-terminal domain-containing protein [Salinicoccus halitifaciens]